MLFDIHLTLKERQTGITTEIDTRVEVQLTGDGYKTFNPTVAHSGTGATPQAAILSYLHQLLHSEEALAFREKLR